MTDSENGGVVNEPKYVQYAGLFGKSLFGSQGSGRVTWREDFVLKKIAFKERSVKTYSVSFMGNEW